MLLLISLINKHPMNGRKRLYSFSGLSELEEREIKSWLEPNNNNSILCFSLIFVHIIRFRIPKEMELKASKSKYQE